MIHAASSIMCTQVFSAVAVASCPPTARHRCDGEFPSPPFLHPPAKLSWYTCFRFSTTASTDSAFADPVGLDMVVVNRNGGKKKKRRTPQNTHSLAETICCRFSSTSNTSNFLVRFASVEGPRDIVWWSRCLNLPKI